VHASIVHVPEVDVRFVLGHDFLNFREDRFPFFLIHLPSLFGEQLIDVRVVVVPAVGAFGRHSVRVEDIIENVGIVIGEAGPAKGVHLKASSADIGKKRGVFQRPQNQPHAHSFPLLCERLGQQPG